MLKKTLNLKEENYSKNENFNVSSPMSSVNIKGKNSFLRRLCEHALGIYEKKSDIKKFTNMVLSDLDNYSDKLRAEKLFSDEKFLKDLSNSDLSDNEKFLSDLDI